LRAIRFKLNLAKIETQTQESWTELRAIITELRARARNCGQVKSTCVGNPRKIAKIVIYDQARVNGGSNSEYPGQRWVLKLV